MDVRLVVYRESVAGSGNESQFELDLQKEPNIITNYKWIDLRNPEQRKSNFSQTIKIPFSNRNNQFFENWFDVNLSTLIFSTSIKYTAVILVDSVVQLEGYIQLKAVYYNARLYEVVVFGDTANFFSDIKDKKLRDAFINNDGTIDRQLDHFNTTSNVVSSWTSPGLTTVLSTTTNDIMYPIIDYGHTISPYSNMAFFSPTFIENAVIDGDTSWSNRLSQFGCVRVGDLKPALRIQKLLHTITQKAGYSIKSTFLGIDDTNASTPVTDTQWFSRMFMTLANDFKSVRTKTFGSFKYTCSSQSTTIQNNFTDANNTNQPNWNTVEYDPETLFSTGTTNVFTIPYNSEDVNVIPTGEINFALNLSLTLPTTSVGGADLTGTDFYISISLRMNNEGSIVLLDQYLNIYAYSGTLIIDDVLTIPAPTNFAGATYEFVYTIMNTSIPGGDTATATYNSGSIEMLNVGDSMFSNGNVNAEVVLTENLPDITQADFIKDLINRFNLIVQSDADNPNLLLIEPYNDYINSGTTQYWTDKLDVSKEQVVKSTNELQSKDKIYSDLPDKDYFNKSYTDSWNTVWGSKNKFNRNDFANGEFRNFSIFSPFLAQGLVSIQNSGATNVALASIFEIDEDTRNRKPMESANARLFYYSGTPIDLSGQDPNGDALSFHIYSGAYSTLATTEAFSTGNKFPLCTQYNLDNLNTGISSTTKILNWTYYNPFFTTGFTSPVFGQGVTTLGLYNEHWSQYNNEIDSEDARIMDCYLKLDEQDIFNFSFANPVYIKNTLWRVLEISNYLVGGNKSTKVTLMKAIEKLTYDCAVVPSTFNVNGTISFVDIITGAASDVTNECCENQDSSWTFQQTNAVTGVGNCYHNQWSPTTPQDVYTSIGLTFGNVVVDPNVSGEGNGFNLSMLPMPIVGATQNDIKAIQTGYAQTTSFSMTATTTDNTTAFFGVRGINFKNITIPANYMVSYEIEVMGTVLIDLDNPSYVGNIGYFTYTTLIRNKGNVTAHLGTAGGQLKTSNKDTNFPLPTAGFTNVVGNEWKPTIQVAGTQKINWVANVKIFMQPIANSSADYFYYAIFQNASNILLQNEDNLIWN